MLAVLLGCMFFALSRAAPVPGVLLTGGNALYAPAISGLSGASQIVYSSQVPLTRTVHYTLTNNIVPFVGSDLLKTAVLARAIQSFIGSSVSSVFTPGVVQQTPAVSSPVEVQEIDNISEVPSPTEGTPGASGALNSNQASLNLDASTPVQQGAAPLVTNANPQQSIIVNDGLTEVIVEELPAKQIVQEGPQNLETTDKIKEESANDDNDTSAVVQDPTIQDSSRDGPLQARSAISLDTTAESTPSKGFPSAPRETYARYYTGPVIERS